MVILYRTVPNEDHMCLLTYSDALPQAFHDEVMKVLESPVGQTAKELSDALFRGMLPDGRNILHSLHSEGLIKKVPTSQVIVTPTTNSSLRLDELNDLLKKMSEGDEAVQKLRDLDEQRGMRNPNLKKSKDKGKDVGEPTLTKQIQEMAAAATPTSDALSDQDLAKQRMSQALTMRKDAERLLAEATRLEGEAKNLDPALNATAKKNVKKVKVG